VSRWLALRVQLDRVVAAVALLAASPVLAICALLVRRDGGPAFVRVPRVGRHGRTFGMWKVRTMTAATPDGVASGPSLAMGERDPRITPIGATLRRWRLDELGNLLNVVSGEMALIGPRPEAPEYVDLDDPAWQQVLAAPPAIAGPTQVLVEAWEQELLATGGADAYRADVLPVKVAVDAWYVRTARPSDDLAVLRGLVGWLGGRRSGQLLARVAPSVAELAAVDTDAGR
jgi:lipopolysaccharide/colanic/teichoic acid biosynthesis glycosyltransferase